LSSEAGKISSLYWKRRRPDLSGLRAVVAGAVSAQSHRWFLWSPVFMGAGAALYIGADREPALWAALTPAIALILLAAIVRRTGRSKALSVAVMLAAFAAAGFAAGRLRTLSLDAPVAPETGAVTISGWVVDVGNPSETGGRLIIAPSRIGDLAPEALPVRIRVTAREDIVGPGMAIRFTGLINPPPPPASPGAYDFARNAWFDRIGGVGVALSEPQIVALPKPGWRLGLTMRINAMRWSLARRIAEKMSPTAAGLGVAMVTGHEAWIDPATEQDLRDSGLAHIVSISGLHMAIVGGFAFFLARLFVAAWPWLALRVPGKKVAAVFGLLAVGAYLVVSGAPPPAERAAITASVAFVAILADRRAISLRSLAIAALIVLTLQPEAVAEAGFQMSFCATAALVALFEAWTRQPREINTPWPIRLVQRAFVWLGLALGASLVAGMATGPFAIQHFNRVAVYGLGANLATEPLSSFVMMPSLALGAALEPLGLGGPFLWLAGASIDLMQAGAAWVSSLPGAVMLVSSAPQAALPVAFIGILWMCLWKGKGRWAGLPAALAISLWPRPEAPVAWIDNEGAQAAVSLNGAAAYMRPEDRLFGAEYWARRRGLTPPEDAQAAREAAFECGGSYCLTGEGTQPRIGLWWTARDPNAAALEALCEDVDILAIRSDVDLPAGCDGAVVLRQSDFAAGGALEIYADGRMVWAQPLRGRRPWSAPLLIPSDQPN
jgi:competence protein ComEC